MAGTDKYTALRAELATLVTESSNPALEDLGSMSTLELAAAMNREDSKVPQAIAAAVPMIASIIDQIAARMSRGGRLIYIGAGTPGRIGVLDASECPPTFGTDPGQVIGVIAGGEGAIRSAAENVEDDAAAGAADLGALNLTEADTVIGISASGRTPYVLSAIEAARAVGAFTVGFACNSGSPLGKQAELPLEIELGPEFLTGSTRLKAGTTQKLVLNMISTITMVRLGKTYRNLMVDLRASNEKLRARSERTVIRATGVEASAAAEALASVGGSVKAAILVLMTGLSPAEASEALEKQHGFLQEAIDQA
ncbi:N-acetylmuramic acid 6-phosphate etherase [Psychromicrobium silvestre]|uniref:N-acetylmuramic acid 6-phosphate etherase n=1 Tax=Psychromicrobium silvestre TaxID=1645614 RepID=A0A7Y9LVL7_9MICC|nr:N-acetylmuramic acid 6-phosphate etherase [Psychromicrobium silvestre]NYE96428.1 N-acetylmuramic acid 6-phosphate etherase [Psychromicrobium silvestre]